MTRSHQMPPQPKQIADSAMYREKPLGLTRSFEPTHLSFPLTRGFMR